MKEPWSSASHADFEPLSKVFRAPHDATPTADLEHPDPLFPIGRTRQIEQEPLPITFVPLSDAPVDAASHEMASVGRPAKPTTPHREPSHREDQLRIGPHPETALRFAPRPDSKDKTPLPVEWLEREFHPISTQPDTPKAPLIPLGRNPTHSREKMETAALQRKSSKQVRLSAENTPRSAPNSP